MNIGATVTPATNNDQAGDEAFLDALSASVTGLDASWNTPISLDAGSTPTGITTSNATGEYRVTEVDLRPSQTGLSALGGSLDVSEWENIKECTLINTAHNSFDTQYPNSIHGIGSSLKYLYLNYSDHSLEATYPGTYSQPHDYAENETPGHLDPGKDSGTGNTIIRGSVGSDINNLTSLEGFMLSWTDDFGANSRAPNTVNGIESIPSTLWDLLPTLKYLQIYDNWNIAGSSNTFSFPATFGGDRPIQQIFLGGGTGSDWDEYDQGFVTGNYPSDIDQLTNVTIFWPHRNSELTGFPDLSGCGANLVSYNLAWNNIDATDFPDWLVDGTCPNLDSIVIGVSPEREGIMEGTTIFDSPWDVSALDNFDVTYLGIGGSIPTGVWDTDPNKINFGVNEFTSIGKTDLTNLVSMSTMRWYRNNIEAEQIPKLDWSRLDSGSPTLREQFNQIRFEQNKYVFADMLYVPDNAPSGETAFELYADLSSSLSTFSYGNQDPAGTANTYNSTDGNGDIVINDFDSVYSHADNSYQWERSTDGGSTWSDISDATSKTYTITNATSSDNGIYRVKVTNSTFTSITTTYNLSDMTLTSAEITVSL